MRSFSSRIRTISPIDVVAEPELLKSSKGRVMKCPRIYIPGTIEQFRSLLGIGIFDVLQKDKSCCYRSDEVVHNTKLCQDQP